MNKVVQKGGYYADFTFVNKSGRAGIPGLLYHQLRHASFQVPHAGAPFQQQRDFF